MMEEGPSSVQLLAAVGVFLGLAIVLGALASLAWTQGGSPWAIQVRSRSTRWCFAGIAATLAASGVGLWLHAAAMAEVPFASAWPAAVSMLRETHFGTAWLTGAVALAVALCIGAVAVLFGRRVLFVASAIGVLVFAYTRSLVSHASMHGGFDIAVWLDWVHLVSGCLWVGIVLLAATAVPTTRPPSSASKADCAKWISLLSATATWSLAVVVLTGVYNAWRSVDSIDRLFDGVWGSALLVKLALVACAVALGGFNRYFVLPELLASASKAGMDDAQRRFLRTVRVEAVVLIGALVAATLLSSTPLPNGH
jgi:putative copper resistance protein D